MDIILLIVVFLAGWVFRGRYDCVDENEWIMINQYRLSGVVCGVNPVSGLPTSVAPANVIVSPVERRTFAPDYQRRQ